MNADIRSRFKVTEDFDDDKTHAPPPKPTLNRQPKQNAFFDDYEPKKQPVTTYKPIQPYRLKKTKKRTSGKVALAAIFLIVLIMIISGVVFARQSKSSILNKDFFGKFFTQALSQLKDRL